MPKSTLPLTFLIWARNSAVLALILGLLPLDDDPAAGRPTGSPPPLLLLMMLDSRDRCRELLSPPDFTAVVGAAAENCETAGARDVGC